ncbi:MAG: hypothetical protein ABI433_09985 [Burkholderiaceae bacterium]
MTAIALLLASFVVVFALGFQQMNVAGRHYVLAVITSFAIGSATLVQFKYLPGPTSPVELAAYFTGSALGIVTSMWAHPALLRFIERRRTRRPFIHPTKDKHVI